MGKFFKPKQIDEIMQFRSGAGYLILKTSDNEVTHCEVYSAGGMFRRVSDGKPVEMQYCDEDGEVFSVSTDTKWDLILKLEATIEMLLRSPVLVSWWNERRSIKVLSAFSKILWSPCTSWAIAAVARTGASQSSPRSSPNMVPRS